MQKYVLIKLLEQTDTAAEFPAFAWPLHVTLVSNFTVDWDNAGMSARLAALLTQQRPLTVTAGQDEYFGAQKQIRVTLLDMNPELLALHHQLVTLLKHAGAIFDEPHYLEKGYRAHVTVQPHARVQPGDAVTIDELTVVDMFPQRDMQQRRPMETIRFASQ